MLITGAGGMLGLDVEAAAQAAGHEVVALARAELDITDSAAVLAATSQAAPDVVINCAAYTRVDDAESDRAGAAAVNAHGAAHIARACAAGGAWLVHISTDYVFDGAGANGPYLESDPTGPISVYGQTKLAGEEAIRGILPDAHTIVRSSWLFGTGGPCFPATILRLAAERTELSVVDDQRGCPTYTPDLARALIGLAGRRVAGTVHVAGGGECTWFEFARAIIRGSGSRTVVNPCSTEDFPRPAPRPAYSVLRTERADAPVLRDWREALAEYLEAIHVEVSA